MLYILKEGMFQKYLRYCAAYLNILEELVNDKENS